MPKKRCTSFFRLFKLSFLAWTWVEIFLYLCWFEWLNDFSALRGIPTRIICSIVISKTNIGRYPDFCLSVALICFWIWWNQVFAWQMKIVKYYLVIPLIFTYSVRIMSKYWHLICEFLWISIFFNSISIKEVGKRFCNAGFKDHTPLLQHLLCKIHIFDVAT